MKNRIRKFLLFITLLLAEVAVYGQATIGKDSKIVLAEKTEVNQTAASILQNFIQKITGVQLGIHPKGKASAGDVLIGAAPSDEVKEDGFYLSTAGGKVVIAGKDKGVVYGVVSLLETYAGVDYWGNGEYNLEKRAVLSLPLIEKTENPAFRYRQTQHYGLRKDSLYKWWYRLEEPKDVFGVCVKSCG